VAKPLMAELSGEGAAMVSLMARYDSQSGRLAVMPVAAGKSEEKSLELWIVDSGGKTRSLGVLPQTGEGEVIVPADMRASFGEGITLAVSLEPFGGSPTGVATGPVIAAGKTYAP
jgi:anti-sigma-K factor RskA